MNRKIKVLLVDDEEEFVKTLAERIEMREAKSEVALNGEEALKAMDEDLPDVMVLDLKMPGIDGLEVVSRLKNSHPGLPVLVLTMHEEAQYIVRAIEAGAMGYLLKDSSARELVQAIRDVHEGEPTMHPSIARKLMRDLNLNTV